MAIRFETFAYLPPLSNTQLEAQVVRAVNSGWVVHIEFAEAPNSADFYWKNWPLKTPKADASGRSGSASSNVLTQIEACARRHPYAYVRFCAYSPMSRGTEMAFIVKTPQEGQ